MTDTSTRHNDALVMDLGTAHKELKPLLFEALSRLVRQQFVVRPDDAVDLIHDFLAHELGGLQRRYEPEKGGFKTYAYKAFIRFARPRIMRLQRFQDSLVDPEALDQISAPDEDHDFDLPDTYRSHVTDAIAALPPNEASILLTYVNARIPSERLLAKSLGISRYETRQTLLRALGQVVTKLPRPSGIAETDWIVARELWRDQCTISEAASHLKLTSQQVRLAQARVTRFLETSLRNVQRTRRYTRRTKMKGERYTIPAHQLFGKVLSNVGNQELLEELRKRADEVIASFGSVNTDEAEEPDVDSEWLAEVYGALAGTAELPKENEALVNAFFKASVNAERSVGEAFQQVLWANLPDHLHDLSRWFDDSLRIDSKQMEELFTDPSVEGGLPESTLLLVYGITPMTIFHATEAVTSVLERLQGYGFIATDSSIRFYRDRAVASNDEQGRLSLDLLVAEIYTSARCDKATARSLYSWLVGVARYRPLLFDTYEATAIDEGVELQRRESSTEDLFQRWRAMAEEKPKVLTATVQAKRLAARAYGSSITVPVYAPVHPSETPSPPNLVAVLMLSTDRSGEEYLKYGVTSGITRSLSLLPGLGVTQPQHISTGQVREVKLLQGLGKELGVKAVLAGWVEPEQNRFRCHAQLVDTEDGEVWQADYHPSYEDIPTFEKDISQKVAHHLGIPITEGWTALLDHSGTDNPEAQKLYMEGRFYWSKWSHDGVQKALSCYERATERVPDFSLAYAGKADCYNVLSDYSSGDSPWSAIIKAKADAYEALEYADPLPEAYASLAYAHTRYWKWDEAETEFQKALKLNPSYVVARKWYAIYLTALGRSAEAIAQVKLAEKYNPSSPILMTALGVTYYFARQYDLAAEQFQNALKSSPDLSFPHLGLGIVYAQTGKHDQAVEILRQARRLFPDSLKGLAALGYVLGDMGQEVEAREILAELVTKSKDQYVSPYSVALIHTALDERDAALENLHKALESKDPTLILLRVDPRFDPIREDRRFLTIASQIGV